MTSSEDLQDNAETESQKAKVYKATGSWKALLNEARAKRFTGTVSMVMPVDSGQLGTYRTLVLPVRES